MSDIDEEVSYESNKWDWKICTLDYKKTIGNFEYLRNCSNCALLTSDDYDVLPYFSH